jgi:glyoxylase-like metal-dependent hydrolase (beta-lactamase superfamily II)
MNLTRRTLLTTASAAAAAAAIGMPAMTPQAFAQTAPAGKQAPSFYRYKVGSFEVTAVSDGSNTFKLADTFVRNASRDDVNAALRAAFLPTDQLTNQYTPVVVNTGSRLIAIDAGRGPSGEYLANLAAAGIDPKAINTVIISHFHGDHIGGLRDKEQNLVFPNAEIMVPAAEWAHWMDDTKMNATPEATRGDWQNVRRIFGSIAGKITRFDADKEITPGIKSIATPGHTPGHTSFDIASGNGRLIYQGDVSIMSYFFVRNPGWHVAFDTDPQLAEATRRKLYEMVAADRLLITGYHWPFPAAGNLEKEGNGYRLHPTVWTPTL